MTDIRMKIGVYTCLLLATLAAHPALGQPTSVSPRAADPAAGLPPLANFVAAARAHATEITRARLVNRQDESLASAELARLLPAFSATGSYTRNQYEIGATLPMGNDFATVVFNPFNQWEATLRADLPLVDFGLWRRIPAARRAAEASEKDLAVHDNAVRELVTRAYFGYLAGRALVEAARDALAAAEENSKVVAARVLSGLASEVETSRATAEVEQRRQDLAASELSVQQFTHSLERLTGIVPRGETKLADSQSAPLAPLERWVAHADDVPAVQAARARAEAAEARREADVGVYLPRVSAFASERFTNAAGFGTFPAWAAGVSATVALDFAAPSALTVSRTRADLAAVDVESALRTAREQIANAWEQVNSYRSRLAAAEAQRVAAIAASTVARSRYAAGTGSQLDLIQANRDTLAAEANLIRAKAELALAYEVLHITAAVPSAERMAP